MADDRSIDHLTPEIFVDLLDGTPVEAERRLHLSQCRQCRGELAELEHTLQWLKAGEGDIESLPPARSLRPLSPRYWLWAVAAAAVAFIAVVLSLDGGGDVAVAPSTPWEKDEEELLPPIDEDEDYRLLLALSQEADGRELLDDWNDFHGLLTPDASGLTPAERRNLLEELARDLRSSS